MDSMKEKIRAMIADIVEVELEEVKDDTKFVEELDADSLKALELLAMLEKEYNVKISEANLKKITTLNNTMAVLQEVMSTVSAVD